MSGTKVLTAISVPASAFGRSDTINISLAGFYKGNCWVFRPEVFRDPVRHGQLTQIGCLEVQLGPDQGNAALDVAAKWLGAACRQYKAFKESGRRTVNTSQGCVTASFAVTRK